MTLSLRRPPTSVVARANAGTVALAVTIAYFFTVAVAAFAVVAQAHVPD